MHVNQAGGGTLSLDSVVSEMSVGSSRIMTCIAESSKVMTKPTATMARCAWAPAIPVLIMTRLLLTLRALWAAEDSMAAANPTASNVGEFHEAAAMPKAMGMSDSSVALLGRALLPSRISVKSTVMSGMAHLEVYVKEIPILSRAMELA